MRIVGVLLILFGLLALAFGGFSFLDRDKVVDLGRVEINRTERENVYIPPIVGGAAIAVGALMLLASSTATRRTTI